MAEPLTEEDYRIMDTYFAGYSDVYLAIKRGGCVVDSNRVKTGLFRTTTIYRARCYGCSWRGPERFGSHEAASADAKAHSH